MSRPRWWEAVVVDGLYGTWGDPRPAVAELRRWLDGHPRYAAELHDVAGHRLVRGVDPEAFNPALLPA